MICFDTNVILDAILRRAPHLQNATKLVYAVENLFGETSTASDFVDLAQNGFCIHLVAPLQGVIWAPFCGFVHCVSASYLLAKQVLKKEN